MKLVKVALCGLLLLLACLAGGALYAYKTLNEPLVFTSQTFDIPTGTGFSAITARMVQREILSEPLIWKIYARLTGKATRVQAGEYQLDSGLSSVELLNKLVEGAVIQHQITLVEGWTVQQMLQAIAKEKRLEHRLTGLTPQQVLNRFEQGDRHPEGLFFPDSYHFTAGTTDEDILRRAHQRLESVLEEEWQQREAKLPYQNAYEALIMASIIERETGQPSERAEIAGVFVRRLQKGMRLQTDPTVIYGLGDDYSGNIRRKHLKQYTPYNTYVIKGLPPTPIAIVGREAIHAALHPKPGKSLYFVAKGDGSHFFSDTLEEHNRAVQRYQLKRVEQYRSSPNSD